MIGVDRTDAVVDVGAVRCGTERHDFGAELVKYRWSDVVRSTMCTVDDDLEPFQVGLVRERALAKFDVAPGRVIQSSHLPESL